jgi:two-component system chemotaxis response regulator CheB
MPIRVIIAAAPQLAAELARALPRPEFMVEASIGDASVLLARCQLHKPQLVLLQLGLGNADALACVRDVMAFSPAPILMVTGPGEDPAHAFQALSFGALDAVRFEGDGLELVQRARLLAGVRVITHVRARRERSQRDPATRAVRLVAVGASLGGPRALAQLLNDLKAPLPLPMLIVQHISDGFSRGLANWLAAETHTPVREAEHQMPLTPGLVAVAPSGKQLGVQDGVAILGDDPPEGGFKPSVSTLFHSVARAYGAQALGVVLTGMGADGADGLLAMRRQGARTLAQDEASCAVFGMPRAAHEVGAVERLIPLDGMAQAIRRVVDS